MDASRFAATMRSPTKEGSMTLDLLAIDLGKRSFHLYGIDTDGVILSKKVSRAKLAEVVGDLVPTAIAMEACASAHHWGRCWLAAGRDVRLINPRFVKPFVKGSKNDAVDAEAIFEAAMRPTMRFVPVKSTDQQDLQSLHRARDRLICQRTALINHTRGLLAEYGIVLPQGPWRFTAQAPAAIAGADLSDLARAIFGELLDELDDLDRRVKKLDATIVALAARMRLVGGSRSCPASARSSPLQSSPPSTMADSFVRAVRWQRGSGWCLDNIRLAASHGSAASDGAPTTTSGAS
jgi:Transposase